MDKKPAPASVLPTAQTPAPTGRARQADLRRPRAGEMALLLTGLELECDDLISLLYLTVELEIRTGWRPDRYSAVEWLSEAVDQRRARDGEAPEPLTTAWAADALRQKLDRERRAMADLGQRLDRIVAGRRKYAGAEGESVESLFAALLSEARPDD